MEDVAESRSVYENVMKHLLIAILWILVAHAAPAQDLVIRKNGDTLSCRIVKISLTQIRFSPAGSPAAVDSIPMSEVETYYYSEGIDNLIGNGKGKKQDTELLEVSLLPGAGYLLSQKSPSVPYEFQKYLNRSHFGFAVNGTAALFPGVHWGFGITGSYFYSGTGTDLTTAMVDSSTTYTGPLSSRLGLAYVAAAVHYRNLSKESKRSYGLCLASGYVNYRDAVLLTGDKIVYHGGTVGISGSVFIDFFQKGRWGIRTGLSFLWAEMDSFEKTRGSESTPYLWPDGKVNLSRLDLFIGIRM